jgi:two-component system, LytTR family, response regulator
MKEMKILIADDEQSARELILYFLSQTSYSPIIFQAADGRSALELLTKEKPDILFLDVKMPELNGIEVLKQRDDAPLPAIIFTTAFDEFALPAFDYEATDYLLKPFGKERFDKALEKAARYVYFVKNAGPWLEQLSIKKGNKTQLIAVNEVQYFRSQGAYVEVRSTDRISLINTPLYELEASLDPARFTRIHKSLIICWKYIKEIKSLVNGDFIVIMNNGEQLRGSRTYRSSVKKIVSF